MKLEGEIGETNVVQQLVEMGRERFTGAVRFENDGIIKIIYFKSGDVMSASTNDRADSVDEILLRAGKISREHIKQALARRKENETLGDALLNLGFITRKELTWARRVQVIGVIRSIEGWPAGQYTVVADYLPKREEGTLFPLAQIIIELIVTDQERQKYERELEGGNAVFDKGPDFAHNFRTLGLNEDAEAIVAQIDGTRSAAEVASVSGKDAFNVYKLLHALSVLGLLTRSDKAKASQEISFETQDEIGFAADASELWSAPAPVIAEEPPHSDGLDMPAIGGPMEEAPVVTPRQVDAAFGSEPRAGVPSWNAPAPAAAAVPPPQPAAPAPWQIPSSPEPPIVTPTPSRVAAPQEQQWGFDEAQIETSRRATAAARPAKRQPVPPPMRDVVRKASKPNKSVFALLGAVAIVAVAFGGFAAWNWWQTRSNASTPVVVTPVKRAPRVPRTTTTATTTTTTVESPATATTSTQSATSSAAPVAAAATAQPAASATATPAAAGLTVTRGAPGAAPADATRGHFDEMARAFAAQATGKYTVQFELVCETPSLATAVREGGQNVWFTPFSYRNRSCYRVFWGHYGSEEEASRAIGQIPGSLRGSKPVVVSVPKP